MEVHEVLHKRGAHDIRPLDLLRRHLPRGRSGEWHVEGWAEWHVASSALCDWARACAPSGRPDKLNLRSSKSPADIGFVRPCLASSWITPTPPVG